MTINPNISKLVAAVTVASVGFAPVAANAQSWASQHRQKSKNNWRNLGIAGGALGALGLLSGNKTLAIAGLAGGAYSAYRYEQDRKSQNRIDRGRAQMFSRPYIYHGGHRYDRKEVWRNGHKYYTFQRH